MSDPIRPEDYLSSDLDEINATPWLIPGPIVHGKVLYEKRDITNREWCANVAAWYDGHPSDETLARYDLSRALFNEFMQDLGEGMNQLRARWQKSYERGESDEGPPEKPFLSK
jgi:hypothetical protein